MKFKDPISNKIGDKHEATMFMFRPDCKIRMFSESDCLQITKIHSQFPSELNLFRTSTRSNEHRFGSGHERLQTKTKEFTRLTHTGLRCRQKTVSSTNTRLEQVL
jgi:hypothetical protein